MQPWFTVERVAAATYAISEYRHWEQAHSYLLIGSEKAVLIDTGLGVGNIRAEVARLTDKPVQVVTTHVHWDHIGGHGLFPDIAVFAAEQDWLNGHFPLSAEAVRANLTRGDCTFPPGFKPEKYAVFQGQPARILRDRDRISLGNRTLDVFHTPGHSPGHVCLFEASSGMLFTGDLVYAGTLDAFYPSTDAVAFRHSLHRMAALPIQHLFPGHFAFPKGPDLLYRAADAFDDLEKRGLLQHEHGIFRYDGFSVHL